MSSPVFFEKVAPIRLYDPLAELLGSAKGGLVTITYSQIVQAAGHSCPTVAGAYLMVQLGLQTLYPDAPPERGMLAVALPKPEAEGVTGVIANVAAQITGAEGARGFKGLSGRFARNERLLFDQPIAGQMRLTRLDTQRSVTLFYDASVVPTDPAMLPLMQRAMQGNASAEERTRFGELWQARIEAILLHHDSYPGLVRVVVD